jgi:hypothetical protein
VGTIKLGSQLGRVRCDGGVTVTAMQVRRVLASVAVRGEKIGTQRGSIYRRAQDEGRGTQGDVESMKTCCTVKYTTGGGPACAWRGSGW